MGESAVLAHSYSYAAPITRNESHEDNTLHALSQSISFGKFVTENLEWGKWSSFSHKKYVEEAEKFSRPGSVAQKKAYFEAHYKRIAEAKKAASVQQPTATPADVLLQTLETQPALTMQDVHAVVTDEMVLSPRKKDDEIQRKSVQIDTAVLENSLDNKPVIADELEGKEVGSMLYGKDEKEKEKDEELSKESWPVGEKEKELKPVTKNRPVFRLSLEKTIPPKAPDTDVELSLPERRSERPMTDTSGKKDQRFSFLSCFTGNAKTNDQNQERKKRKTEQKKSNNKSFMCFCFKQ